MPKPPDYTRTAVRDHQFGYPTRSGVYLGTVYLNILKRAFDGREPDFTDEWVMSGVAEMQADGLLDGEYRITPDGLWHLQDRGWV